MAAKKSAVAKATGNNVVEFNPTMFAADAGMGVDSLGHDDLSTPFLKLVQTNIQATTLDANIGDLFNTVTNQVWAGAEGLSVINCGYTLVHLEWSPKDSSSKKPPVNRYTALDTLPDTARGPDGKEVLSDGSGNYLEKTAEHFVLVLDEDDFAQQALITMKSTGLKISKQWNSTMRSMKMKDGKGNVFVPPRFSHIWRLTTISESNSKGEWSQWQVAKERVIQCPDLYGQARAFAALISAGAVEVKHVQEDKEEFSDNIPF